MAIRQVLTTDGMIGWVPSAWLATTVRMPAWVSHQGPVMVRLLVAVPVGLVVAIAIGVRAGWSFAPVVGWISAAAVYLVWTWLVVGTMSAESTASHATREDPTRLVSNAILLSASVASLGGVGYLLVAESAPGGQLKWAAAAGVASVTAAWLVVHTAFSLHYARLYYLEPAGGVNFHQDEPPTYLDFAYLGFTIGMTYQVSDTDLHGRAIRAAALRHALLSYLLGAVVLAITINLIAGLGNSFR
jgi:uncharacterized membrane protein